MGRPAGKFPPKNAPHPFHIEHINFAAQKLLALKMGCAHPHQQHRQHQQPPHRPPQGGVIAPEHHHRLALNEQRHGNDDEAGQQIGRAHRGGLRRDHHRPRHHHHRLHDRQREDLKKHLQRRQGHTPNHQARQVHRHAQEAGHQRRNGGRQQLTQIQLPVFQRRVEQGLNAAALFFAHEGFQGDHQRDRDGEEAHDHQQERHQALANDGGPVAVDKAQHLLGGEIHQEGEKDRQAQHRKDDTPIAQLVAHLAAGDHQSRV